MPSNPAIRSAMANAAAAMNDPHRVQQALAALTQGAVDAIPGADYSSISTRRRDGTLETSAATDPLVDKLDAWQYELREGPCYEAATSEVFTASFDMSCDPRWPNYGPVAAEAGVRGQLAVMLVDNGSGRSALNVYAAEAHCFDTAAVEMAELFASHAAVAMGFVGTVSTLSNAVVSRQSIGTAVGMVAERYHIDSERAFQFLLRTSQDSNVKLRDVAEQIVAGHDGRSQLGLPPDGQRLTRAVRPRRHEPLGPLHDSVDENGADVVGAHS